MVIPAQGELAYITPDFEEERARLLIADGIRAEAPQLDLVSATPVTAGCRMIKSAAEIALMQRANDITIAAYRAAFPTMPPA